MNKIVVYGISECTHCTELKNMLRANKYPYIYIDVSLDEHEEEFDKVIKKTGSDNVPVVLYDNHLLAPGVSFNSLDDLMKIIEDLYNE